ncbi:MAG: S41 family peptidase [Ferruginibacter sp.]
MVGVLLTNDQTASAGDVLAMILKALPQTSIIGENSLGIYSAMYGFELPNKWQVSLSSQKYYSSKMICYEGNGTPVNIRVKNTKEDIKAIQDPVVSAAFRYLKKRKSKIGLFIVKMKTEANFAKYGLPIT